MNNAHNEEPAPIPNWVRRRLNLDRDELEHLEAVEAAYEMTHYEADDFGAES